MLEFILCFAIFMLIGIGPSLYLVAYKSPQHQYNALLIAPAFGIGVITVFITNIVYLFDIAIINYLWIFLVIPILISGLLTLLYFRNHYRDMRRLFFSFNALFLLLGIVIVGGLLALPGIVGGPGYRVWQGNGTDWFNYNLMAFYRLNFDSASFSSPTQFQEVAYILPFLYNLGRPGVAYVMAWFSGLYDIPIHQFQFYYALSLTLPIFTLGIAIGRLLKMKLVYTVALGGVLTLGFWSYIIRDINALSQTGSLPLTLLMLYAWLDYEKHNPEARMSRERLMLSVSLAFIFIMYPEVLPLIVGSFIAYYAIRFFDNPSQTILKQGMLHSITAIIALIVALPTVGHTFSYMTEQIGVGASTTIASGWELFYFPWLYSNDNMLTNLWGLHPYLVFREGGSLIQIIFVVLLFAVTIGLVTFLVRGFIRALAQPAKSPEATIFLSTILTCFGGGVFMHFIQSQWTGGKFIVMGSPFLVVGIFFFAHEFIQKRETVAHSGRIARWIQAALPIIFIGWVLSQIYTPLIRTTYIMWGTSIRDYPIFGHPIYNEILPVLNILKENPDATIYSFFPPDGARWSLMVNEYNENHVAVDGAYYSPDIRKWETSDTLPDFWMTYKNTDYFNEMESAQVVNDGDVFMLYRISPQEIDASHFLLNVLNFNPHYHLITTNFGWLFFGEEDGILSRWMKGEQSWIRFIASGETRFMLSFEGKSAYTGEMRVILDDTQAVIGEYPVTDQEVARGIACFTPTPATNNLGFAHDGQLTESGDMFLVKHLSLLPVLNQVDIGYPFTDRQFIGDGWESDEQWGDENIRWSNQQATFSIPLCPDEIAQTTHLRFRAFYSPELDPQPQVVTIGINGTEHPPITLLEGWHEYDIELIDGVLLTDDMQKITLSHAWGVTSATDTRQLSVAYDWFELGK